MNWDEAWDVTTHACAYTNHTIMSEALEKWPVDCLARLLPRIYQIVEEINHRFVEQIRMMYPGNEQTKLPRWQSFMTDRYVWRIWRLQAVSLSTAWPVSIRKFWKTGVKRFL